MEKDMNSNKPLWDDSHRKWSLPHLPWIIKQTWNDLMFVHYPVKLEVLQKLVPDVLRLDTFNGVGWVGIVPFHMTGVRLRGLPSIPGAAHFPQVNVRTYVTIDDKPGVFFLSLDAANWLAAKTAKTFYHIPYHYAEVKVQQNGAFIDLESRRRTADSVKLMCSYRPISEPYLAVKGSFDEWMAERYCFYTVNKKGVPLRCDILHQPWQLQQAEAVFSENTLLSEQEMQVENDQPILHFSKRMDVRAWPLIHASD